MTRSRSGTAVHETVTFHGGWPTLSRGPHQQHLGPGPVQHHVATRQGGTQFPHCLWNAVNHYSPAEKLSLWCLLPWGGRGPPYLVSGNGKPALTVWREIAVHPSRALFLIASAEQVALTGSKHTGLRCWDTGHRAGQVLRSMERWPTSSPLTAPPSTPCCWSLSSVWRSFQNEPQYQGSPG